MCHCYYKHVKRHERYTTERSAYKMADISPETPACRQCLGSFGTLSRICLWAPAGEPMVKRPCVEGLGSFGGSHIAYSPRHEVVETRASTRNMCTLFSRKKDIIKWKPAAVSHPSIFTTVGWCSPWADLCSCKGSALKIFLIGPHEVPTFTWIAGRDMRCLGLLGLLNLVK